LFALAQLGFFILFALTGSPYLILLIIAGFFLLYEIAFSVKSTLFMLSFYIIVFPAYGWGKNYPFLRVFVSYPAVTAIILLAVLFWFAMIALKCEVKIHLTAQDVAILIFLFVIVLSLFIGFVNGHQSKHILKEFFFLSFYGVYLLVVKGAMGTNWVKQFWSLLVIATLVVSLTYILLTLSEIGASKLFITRVTTQQPHVAQLVVPYLVSFFLFPSSQGKKVVAFILLIPILSMVFLCQQRSLWIGVPFSIALLWIFSVCRRRISLRAVLKALMAAILIFIVVISILLILDKLFTGSTVATLAVRIDSMTRLAEDESALLRMAEISRALEQWKRNILLGTGLGSTIHRVAVRMTYDVVDNSYIFILWKTGLIGFFSYAAIIVLFFQRGLNVFKRTDDLEIQRIVASSLSGFAGLMLIALTNTCLMLYRFTLIWAILFASLELLYCRSREKNQTRHLTVKG